MAVVVLRRPRPRPPVVVPVLPLADTDLHKLFRVAPLVVGGDDDALAAAVANVTSTEANTGSTGQSEKVLIHADGLWVGSALVLLGIGIFAGWYIADPDHPSSSLAETSLTNAFALLYIFAQSLERIAEFTAMIPWIGHRRTSSRSDAAGKDAAVNKEQAAKRKVELLTISRQEPVPLDDPVAAQQREQELAHALAEAQDDIDVIRSNRAVFFFAFNAALAAVIVGYLEIQLLGTAGVRSAPVALDIAVTALAVSGGSKPLHDLITNIQKTKEQKEDQPQTFTA